MSDEPRPIIRPGDFRNNSSWWPTSSWYWFGTPSADTAVEQVKTNLSNDGDSLSIQQEIALREAYEAQKANNDSKWWWNKDSLTEVFRKTVLNFNDPDVIEKVRQELLSAGNTKKLATLDSVDPAHPSNAAIIAESELLKAEATAKLAEATRAAVTEPQRSPVVTTAVPDRTVVTTSEPDRRAILPAEPSKDNLTAPAATQTQASQAPVFEQFAKNFAEMCHYNPSDPNVHRLFSHIHMTALRGEDGMKLHPDARKAFYSFLEKGGYLDKPEQPYPQDFQYPLNTKEIFEAANKWKARVQADQNALLSDDPNPAVHDGVAGKLTLAKLEAKQQEKKNIPPAA